MHVEGVQCVRNLHLAERLLHEWQQRHVQAVLLTSSSHRISPVKSDRAVTRCAKVCPTRVARTRDRGESRDATLASRLLRRRVMKTLASFPSSLSLLAGVVICGALVACGGTGTGSGSGSGSTGGAAEQNGSADQGGSCTSPTPIVAESAVASACLAQLQYGCASALAACAADCTCSKFTNGCLNDTDGIGSALNCEVASGGDPVADQIFLCMNGFNEPPSNDGNRCDVVPSADAGSDD
jgi:hypothetical protein